MLCHGRPGQRWTFYEIDPEVVRIATDPDLFSFLDDCGPRVEVDTGDARLSLARELASSSEWVVLADDAGDLGPAASDPRWRPLRGGDGPQWTDDHAAVVELFR